MLHLFHRKVRNKMTTEVFFRLFERSYRKVLQGKLCYSLINRYSCQISDLESQIHLQNHDCKIYIQVNV